MTQRSITLEIVVENMPPDWTAQDIAQGIHDGLPKEWFSDDGDPAKIMAIRPADGAIVFSAEASDSYYTALDDMTDYTVRIEGPKLSGDYVLTGRTDFADGGNLTIVQKWDDENDGPDGVDVSFDPYTHTIEVL